MRRLIEWIFRIKCFHKWIYCRADGADMFRWCPRCETSQHVNVDRWGRRTLEEIE